MKTISFLSKAIEGYVKSARLPDVTVIAISRT